MSHIVKEKILINPETRLEALCKELTQIDGELDRTAIDKRVQYARSKSGASIQIVVRKGDHGLKELGRRIAEIDAEFQASCGFTSQALKKQFQGIFERVFTKFIEKVPLLEEKEKEKRSSAKQVQLATETIESARAKIEAEEAAQAELGEEGCKPVAKDLLPFAQDSNPLFALYRVSKGTPAEIAQAFLDLPLPLRTSLLEKLDIEIDASALDGMPAGEEAQYIASRLRFLSLEERSYLRARLENSSKPEHRALARYIHAFEEIQQEVALQVASKGAGPIAHAIGQIVHTTIEASGVDPRAFAHDTPITTYQAPAKAALLEPLTQAERERGSVFALFYAEVASILHKSISEGSKKEAVKALIAKLPPSMQQDLYGKVHELNPARQPREGWGERHVLDHWGILLGAAAAYCPAPADHPLNDLLKAVQKIVHNPKMKPAEVQQAVRVQLDKAKASLPAEAWGALKGQFYQSFPGKEKEKWGWGGEEREAHKYPYHLLATLYSMTVPFSNPSYWSGLREGIEGLPEHDGSNESLALARIRAAARLLPLSIGQPLVEAAVLMAVSRAVEKSAEEATWQCYNAITSYQRASVLDKYRAIPHFDKMWRMSPLCRGVYSGKTHAIDPNAIAEIDLRFKIITALEIARNGAKQYPVDLHVWDTLIHRIILQEAPLDKIDQEEFAIITGALEDLAADEAYHPAAAKEILQLIIDMSSRRLVAEEISKMMPFSDKVAIQRAGRGELGLIVQAKALQLEESSSGGAYSVTDARLLALSWPLFAKPLDFTGPTQFKSLLFFRDQGGHIRAKLKPLDPAIGNNGKYTIEHFYRELASSQMNDAYGLNITVPTIPFRLTLGEGILMLADRYLVEAPVGMKQQDVEILFQHTHPLLQEAIKRRLPSWDRASPQLKSRVLREFYEKTGTTDLLKLIVAKLTQGEPMAKIAPLFRWLPANTRNAVYGAVYQIKPPAPGSNAPFNYGEMAFYDEQFTTTFADKIKAIKTLKEFSQDTGLQPSYPEEGLGALQPWQAGVREVTSVLAREEDGGDHLVGLPKERVDLYAISHLLKGHGDSHTGNTLLSQSDHFVDCDEEHAVPSRSHFDDQIMWELGLPQSKTPVKRLVLRPLLHPYFQRASMRVHRDLLQPRARGDFLEPYKRKIQMSFSAPLDGMLERAQKLQGIAAEGIKKKRALSTRDMFFELYGGRKEYQQLTAATPKERHAVIFEQCLGKSSKRVVPLRQGMKPLYHKNVRVISR